MSLLDRDHHEGNLLDRIAQLEAQLEALERAVAMGLFAPGSTTMLLPGQLEMPGLATQSLKVTDAGSAGATQQGWIEVEVGGVKGYVRVYGTK